ncbi:S-layer homology domain-containing protein, partial [Aduncisulcus paluster]
MMTANKITSGRTETAFEPDAPITRAEFAAYLVNMIGLEGEMKGNFKDVSEDAWYYNQVGLAGVNGLVSGVGDGNFAPDATVT